MCAPRRHWLDLPKLSPAGGLSFFSPAYPAFGLLSCPLSPQPPSPAGKGENQSYFMQGASPLASPGAEPERHLQSQQKQIPGGRCAPGGTCYPCPGGEDHLKRRRRVRRIVPSPPVPPLLGWRHCPEIGGAVGFASSRQRRRHAPIECRIGKSSQRRPGSGAGMQGAKPLA